MISERIKQLRKRHNLTQTEFGELFGVGKTTVSSWETNNSSPSDEIKIAICKRFNVSMDWLFGIEKKFVINVNKSRGTNNEQAIIFNRPCRKLRISGKREKA